ncbi:MAG: hypothetical protein FJZ16_01320 [Candidatus Omnitrophica bacterium]|nr:hypothetical protein [Candidatus Omnitrophota bacterium]
MIKRKEFIRKGLFFFALLLTVTQLVFAQDDDIYKKCEGKYFIIYYQPDIDILDILQKIDFGPSLHLLNKPVNGTKNLDVILSKTIDELFLEVSDILDIHMYSFKGNIKICRDLSTLNRIFDRIYNKNLNSPSFYINDINTVYISLADLKVGMLGHEMAHAIISHYFVVPPPMKVQEVLAGYVEYQLRKTGRKK